MGYVVVALISFVGGGICVFVALDQWRRRLNVQKEQQDSQANWIRETLQSIGVSQKEIQEQADAFKAETASIRQALNRDAADLRAEEIAQRQAIEAEAERVKDARTEFEKCAVSYKELLDENTLLKRDLLKLDVHLRKSRLDRDEQQRLQDAIQERVNELGKRYLSDHVKWIGAALTANNFVTCKQRLLDVIERCRGIGFDVSDREQGELVADLKKEFELVVRAALEREEQARIKAQIREEQARDREIAREIKKVERDRDVIQAALNEALRVAHDEHSAEIESLRARLAEAEARAQRTISQAELTKAGHVYVISNIGSFGEGIFKIGMTRRLEPDTRIRELADASVPFPFDIHMMISADDAPSLENALHRALHKARINKMNPRKEFFKTDIETIFGIVKQNHGEVEYIADMTALEYRQSLEMGEDDEEFIERVYDRVLDDGEEDLDES
jgi:hypothetical protein